jgi:hypothetical protein
MCVLGERTGRLALLIERAAQECQSAGNTETAQCSAQVFRIVRLPDEHDRGGVRKLGFHSFAISTAGYHNGHCRVHRPDLVHKRVAASVGQAHIKDDCVDTTRNKSQLIDTVQRLHERIKATPQGPGPGGQSVVGSGSVKLMKPEI